MFLIGRENQNLLAKLKDCIKACHPKCIGEDDSFVNSGNSWTCDAHSCFICRKGQDFNCVGCPKALCRQCIGLVEFVQIKGNKGLCRVCLNFGLLFEDKKDGDYDRQFMEHFGSAWKIIRERESLTLKDLRYAEDRMNKGKFYMSGCDSDENDELVKSDIYDTFPKKNKKSRSFPRVQYALIEPENMTLVYLKRGLVKKLVKEPRTLSDDKLIGSFVKIKADRNDRFDQNIFKLVQVTGTTWNCSGENDPEILLHVSGMENKIGIDLLSNVVISEDECKDLKIRIQRGLLKQPTVDELEHKARILHEDITKHWIATELQRLKSLFERACERRWRGEMIEYDKKREHLLKPDEQAKLLNTIPHVVAAAEGELELLSKNGKNVEQEDERCLKTPVSDGSRSGDKSVIERNSSPSQGDGVGKVTEDLSRRFDSVVNWRTYSRERQCIATSHGQEIAHLETNPTAELDTDYGEKEIMGQSSSLERKKIVKIGPVNDGGGEPEKVEGSTEEITEGYGDIEVEDNGPSRVPVDDKDLKIQDEIDPGNTENSTAIVTEGNERVEDDGRVFDEQIGGNSEME